MRNDNSKNNIFYLKDFLLKKVISTCVLIQEGISKYNNFNISEFI